MFLPRAIIFGRQPPIRSPLFFLSQQRFKNKRMVRNFVRVPPCALVPEVGSTNRFCLSFLCVVSRTRSLSWSPGRPIFPWFFFFACRDEPLIDLVLLSPSTATTPQVIGLFSPWKAQAWSTFLSFTLLVNLFWQSPGPPPLLMFLQMLVSSPLFAVFLSGSSAIAPMPPLSFPALRPPPP